MEVREHDQYSVKMDGTGRLSLRNRKFLRPSNPYNRTLNPSAHTANPTVSHTLNISPQTAPSSAPECSSQSPPDSTQSGGEPLTSPSQSVPSDSAVSVPAPSSTAPPTTNITTPRVSGRRRVAPSYLKDYLVEISAFNSKLETTPSVTIWSQRHRPHRQRMCRRPHRSNSSLGHPTRPRRVGTSTTEGATRPGAGTSTS